MFLKKLDVAFVIAYSLGPSTSQLFLGALSLKGDYPHLTAHSLPVYTSHVLLPDMRKTRYMVLFLTSMVGLSPTSKRQLRLAYIPTL